MSIRASLATHHRHSRIPWSYPQVYVPYCTSDSWSGNSAANQPGTPFIFRGMQVVQYVTEDLLLNHVRDVMCDG